ncbi:TPM domain-containing protein, partial [Xanthomonas citri pv. citri]|nr:TPM domain-containing protein [Xanthomonas citri pv. citri]
QQKIYDEHIAPALRTGDWDGAAQGAVDGIDRELGGAGAGGAVTGLLLAGGVAAAGVGAATVMRSRRRRAQGGQPGPGGPS